jgi:hypothetical protein
MLYSVIIFVPVTHADAIRAALASSGAGAQGAYDSCSFSCVGTGRFRPLAGANPFLGRVGEIESVAEERIETDVSAANLSRVLAAVRAAHPYEEPGIHVVALADPAIASAELDGEVAALRARLGMLEKLMRETLAGIVKDMRAWQASNRKTLMDAVAAAKGGQDAAAGGEGAAAPDAAAAATAVVGTGLGANASVTPSAVLETTAAAASASSVLPSRYTSAPARGARGGVLASPATQRGPLGRGAVAAADAAGGSARGETDGDGKRSDSAAIADLAARCAACEDAVVALSEALTKTRTDKRPASASPRVSFVEPPHYALHHDSLGQGQTAERSPRVASIEATLSGICEALQEHTELLEEHSSALAARSLQDGFLEALDDHSHILSDHSQLLSTLSTLSGTQVHAAIDAPSEQQTHYLVKEWDYS